MQLSGRAVAYATVVLSANVRSMEILTLQNTFIFKYITKLRSRLRHSHLKGDKFKLNIVRECHFVCASVVFDDGRACATVDL